jgi:hypothetical protein
MVHFMTDVDLVVNVWERTWRNVLEPGYFPAIEEQNGRSFRKVLLINNVTDMSEVMALADARLASGEIDSFYVLEKELPRALEILGLKKEDLGRIPYYSSPPLVALVLPGNDWLLYWDAEIHLRSRYNWVDPALEMMERNANIHCANPAWAKGGVAEETLATFGEFAVGYGFSDQCFLARRSDFIHQDWRCQCLASLRYPLSHITPIFEQRVDAFMRRRRKFRATCLSVTYEHPDNEGASYPPCTLRERLRRKSSNLILAVLNKLPVCNSCLKSNPKPSCFTDTDVIR